MRVLVNKLLKNALLSQFVANFIGFIANFNLFRIFFTKNIANMHCEHDVLFFFKHCQKHFPDETFFSQEWDGKLKINSRECKISFPT